MKIHLVFCILAVSVLTADSEPQLIDLPATVTYTNAVSNFQFAPKIGSFVRGQIHRFDNDGRDIGVGYNNHSNGIAVTVFVYPVASQSPNDNLEGHFGTCKSDILRRHKNARSIADRTEQVSAGGQKRNAKYACYAFTDDFGQRRQRVHSELYLFSQERWFIKFRATYPVAQQAVAEATLETFINDLGWP